MDKLIKYLKEELKLSDEIVKVVLENIKIKYVVPTYYYKDWLFTDLNVLDDVETGDPFYNLSEFNESEMSSLITSIIDDKGRSFIPKRGLFGHLKEGKEYWAIYKDGPPINIVVAVDRFVGDSGRFSVHTGLSLHTGPIVGNSAAVEDAAEESTTAEWAGLLWFEAGVTFRATDWLDLMVEGMGAATMTNDSGFRALPYALVNYGVRFFGDFVAADVALMRPLGDLELGWLVMGLPYLGLSARF